MSSASKVTSPNGRRPGLLRQALAAHPDALNDRKTELDGGIAPHGDLVHASQAAATEIRPQIQFADADARRSNVAGPVDDPTPDPDRTGGALGHGVRPLRPRQPALRKPLPAHLPRETVVHEPEILCGCTDPRLVRMGEDVTEVLEKIPARHKVIRHVRPKYACRCCERVFQAPAPDLPIEKGRPGPGLIANVVVAKYCDGLPLYRQSVILAREGIDIDRVTLADWVGHAVWWLTPLAELIGAYIMASPVLHTDDTTISVLAPGLGRSRIARFWVYATDPSTWAGTGPAPRHWRCPSWAWWR